MRQQTYALAIREAHEQLLRVDQNVFLIGQGLWSPWYAGASLLDLDREFGRHRIIDSPVSENSLTGAAVGAAIMGMRPIVFHPRMDFMLLAVDPIVNQASNWSYLFSGQVGVSMVIRTVINRGGEQGAQHSQALQGMFMHVPGLKIVMPSTPYDAKGLLISAVYDGNPVLYIDDRWLYEDVGNVPENMYQVPIGKGEVRRSGKQVTIVVTSFMVNEAMRAAEKLKNMNIDAEIIDLRSIKPWDRHLVFSSVTKTGRLLIVDGAWSTAGVAAEISATVASEIFHTLKAPIQRLGLPDVPAPTSKVLEKVYYICVDDIVKSIEKLML